MLQQTQVATATPYYARFLQHFPTLATLANAPVGEVMALWSGLGYYARARNLHACARVVMAQHGGQFPHHPEQLAALPGIGPSTANSIATFCFGSHAPILDGNVKRVLTRAFGIKGFPGSAIVEKQLWSLAEDLMPAKQGDTYIQAQMDLGATLCTRSKPRCGECPLEDICVASATGRQAELPHRKPRAAIPEREVTVLILRHNDKVLVEQRPPHGIWGGLWSLPELPDGQSAAVFISSHLRCACDTVSPAPTRSHTFTHFRLQIRPLVCAVTAEPQVMETGTTWLSMDSVNSVALPAPIKRLLSALI